jgi:DNA repair exonuclease SbcCD ATPase subunit
LFEVESVRFGNFGRFVGEHHLSFANLPRLNQVDGHNKNTGGSSAGGKTTLLRVIDYGLGINDVPATILQSRLTKDPMFTEIIGKWNGSPVVIYRAKGDIRVTGTNPKTGEQFSITGNAVLAEEKIDQILELPRDLFKKITHKEQGEGGFFLKMGPKDAYEFMLKATGMQVWLDKMKKVEADITAITPEIAKLEAALGATKTSLEFASNQLTAAENIVEPTEPDTSYLIHIEQRTKEISKEIQELDVERKAKISELNNKEPQKPEFAGDFTERDALKVQVDHFQSLIKTAEAEKSQKIKKIKDASQVLQTKIDQKQNDKTKKTKDIEKLEREIVALKTQISEKPAIEKDLLAHAQSKCPTCLENRQSNQNLQTHAEKLKAKLVGIEKAEIRIPIAQQEIEVTKGEIDLIASEVTELQSKEKVAAGIYDKMALEDPAASLRKELEQHRIALSEVEKTLNDQKQELNDQYTKQISLFFSIKKKVEDQFSEKRRILTNEVEKLATEEKTLKGIAEAYKNAVASRKRDVEHARKQLDLWSGKILMSEADYYAAKKRLTIYEDAKRAIKGFTMSQFESFLDQIGRKASETVGRIPNMATATISFEPFKEVKGKIKDEIVATISMDGEEAVPIKSLCGGERNVADVSVDLAVIDIVEERSGIGSNYYILDEPTSALDDICKSEFMDALIASSSKKTLFVVEHSPAIKEKAQNTIVVERMGLTARIL